jgi:GDPmannose 4,6-dehydratase
MKKKKSSPRKPSASRVVVGAGGQDGTLLTEALESGGSSVWRIFRRKIEAPRNGRSRAFSVLNRSAVRSLIQRVQPKEVFYLAAHHASAEAKRAEDGPAFERAYEVHVRGLWNFLEAIRDLSPKTRLLYASSSRVYGTVRRKSLDESAPLSPEDVYSLTKSMGMLVCRFFREGAEVFASSAVLFNHESHLRGKRFVSRRIVDALKRGGETLSLRDPSARADWMHARDAVAGMRAILRCAVPGEFVVASGKTHSVEEFARAAARSLGVRPPKLKRAPGKGLRRGIAAAGDASKLRRQTGWRPRLDFEAMVDAVVRDLSKR